MLDLVQAMDTCQNHGMHDVLSRSIMARFKMFPVNFILDMANG
jgi:hypothetical protein